MTSPSQRPSVVIHCRCDRHRHAQCHDNAAADEADGSLHRGRERILDEIDDIGRALPFDMEVSHDLLHPQDLPRRVLYRRLVLDRHRGQRPPLERSRWRRTFTPTTAKTRPRGSCSTSTAVAPTAGKLAVQP